MFKKEKIKDLHYIVNGVLTADEIQAVADEILVGYGAKAKLPGFRPGKIPLNILRQKFGASATGEAIDKAMNRDMEKYVADKKIRLAGSPKADVAKDWKPGSDLEYTLEFDILPSAGFNGNHTTTVNESGKPTRKDLLEVAMRIGFSASEFEAIYQEILELVTKNRI